MPYLRFFVYNALGCALWAVVCLCLATFWARAGTLWKNGWAAASAILAGLLLLFLGFIWLWRWRRTKR